VFADFVLNEHEMQRNDTGKGGESTRIRKTDSDSELACSVGFDHSPAGLPGVTGGLIMIIQKTDLFSGLSPESMNEISKIMVEESHDKGSLLFKAGDPSTSFYLILDGAVTLSIGTAGEIDYTANRPGEAFGWTGMVDRPAYVATAKCSTPCKVIKIEKEKLNVVLGKDPVSSATFFKRLAGAVVQRLIDNYGTFLAEGGLKGVTYGTGQVMGSEE
jgi:hypothetical protein